MIKQGFTLGRLQVNILFILSKEPMPMYRMFKIPDEIGSSPLAVQNALMKLQEKNLIEQVQGKYRLTNNGRKMVEILEAQ